MSAKTMYKQVMPHKSRRPRFEVDAKKPLLMLADLLRIHLNISTWLALGATLQALLVALPVPTRYTLAHGVLFLLYRISFTFLVAYNLIPNPQLKGVIHHRCTAIVPDKYGNFPAEGEAPAKQKVAVLLLTARVNHPGGWFASPHIKEFRGYFKKMNDELYKLPQFETGFLGHSQAYMPGEKGSVGMPNFSYWRSRDDIQRYAESPAHRAGMKWFCSDGGYDGKGGKIPHIAIGHEVYESAPGQWENVSMSSVPTGLAATAYLRQDAQAEKGEWISPVVDARRGKLAASRGRLGLPMTRKGFKGFQI